MITSKQNQLIKLIRSLTDKKTRDETGLFTVEGVKSVKEAINSNLELYALIYTEKHEKEFSNVYDVQTELVSPELMDYISTEVTPQGVLAVVKKPCTGFVAPTSSSVLLDGVSDPGNVGSIIRTAVAFGYNEIYLTQDSADPYSQKAVRASMSGIFKAKVYITTREEVKEKLGIPIIVADMNGEDVFNFKIKSSFCLVIGNEAHGVSDEILSLAKGVVKIPMQNGMESLNASVSAGILLYNLKTR